VLLGSPTLGISQNTTPARSQPELPRDSVRIRRAAGGRFYAAIFVVPAATLLLELVLTRIFDVILWNNLAYLVISSAIFGFGLAGIFLMLWPRLPRRRSGSRRVGISPARDHHATPVP
jgi:hypothetical protein